MHVACKVFKSILSESVCVERYNFAAGLTKRVGDGYLKTAKNIRKKVKFEKSKKGSIPYSSALTQIWPSLHHEYILKYLQSSR
jgi:hypothetical protein